MGLIYTVPQSHCVIIERLGKFSRIQHAGLRFRLPFIESQKDVQKDCGWGNVACKQHGTYSFIELADQRLDTAPRKSHTKDNVEVNVDSAVFWRITDPRAAVYAVDRLIESLEDLALNTMRGHIGTMTLDEILSNRQQLNEHVAKDVAATAQKWGITIQRVEIKEFSVDESTKNAMRAEMEAERVRRATLLAAEGESQALLMKAEAEKKALVAKADGEKSAAILRAEGESRAQILRAEADAQYLAAVAKSVNASSEDVLKLLVAQKYVEGFNAISQNPADKVFLPSSAEGLNLFLGETKAS